MLTPKVIAVTSFPTAHPGGGSRPDASVVPAPAH